MFVMLFADGFEECLIGVGSRCGQPDIAVYDQTKCIQVLMSQGMSHEEALEYFDFNVLGSWVGKETPIFVSESKLDD